MWILTTEYNNYDQYGEYFVACWLKKPKKRQLINAGVGQHLRDPVVQHVLKGGGRIHIENQWWNLFQAEEGKSYHD